MNKERRKAIADLSKKIAALADYIENAMQGAPSAFEDLATDCDDLENDEREYFDNMPESLQGGEKGSAAEAACEQLAAAKEAVEKAKDLLDEAIEVLRDDAIGALDEAAGG